MGLLVVVVCLVDVDLGVCLFIYYYDCINYIEVQELGSDIFSKLFHGTFTSKVQVEKIFANSSTNK